MSGHDWREDAACRPIPGEPEWKSAERAEDFFPVGESASTLHQARKIIDQYCRPCPVRAQCLNDAPEHGIWGGFTEGERRSMKRREARQRQAAELSGKVGVNLQPESKPTFKDSQYVEVEPTRALLQGAKDAGWKVSEMSALTDVHSDTIWALLARKQERLTYRVARKVAAHFTTVEAR